MADNDELNKGKKILEEQVEVAGHLDNAFKSIAANMAVAFEEVIDGMRGVDEIGEKIAKSYERDIVNSIRKMSGGLENQLGLQLKIENGQNVSKEIEEQINKAKVRSQLTSEKITRAEGLGVEEKKKLKQQLKGQLTQELKALNILKNNNIEKQKTRGFGIEIAEGLGDQLNKLDKSGTLSGILKGNFQGVAGSIKLAQAVLAGVVKALIAGNKSVTALQRDLGTSGVEATVIRAELSGATFAANDLRVTTEGLLKANKALNSEYQTAAVFNKDILVGATSALDAQIMSGEAISQLSGDAARLGQTFDESLKTQENAVNAINSQTGAQISLKTVLEASNKVSGQIRAQLGANPEAIARAVTQAKALGFELEQIANSGEALLQFESSIGAELEAELLTGKQLNLEKARLAALTGDYETLTAEIAANVGDFNDFSQMNVLQQKAIAAAVGMTADSLANSLITEENRDQLLKDAIASGNEQSVQQLKALDTQEKFAKVTEQVKGLIIDIAAVFSPVIDVVGLIADGLGTIVGKIGMAVGAMILLRKLSIGTAIANIISGNAKLGPLGIVTGLAAVAAMMGAISNATKVDDAVLFNPEDKFSLVASTSPGALAQATSDIAGGGGISDEQIGKLASIINSKEVRFDSYSASGPQGIVNTERRQASNLFA